MLFSCIFNDIKKTNRLLNIPLLIIIFNNKKEIVQKKCNI